MNIIVFDYFAKFGHFLRAEAGVSGITYPVPPRTALLGLVGAVLGMEKDEPQTLLRESSFGVGGPVPSRLWHRVNIRKDPPNPLPRVVKLVPENESMAGKKPESKPEKNCRLSQEWLWEPRFRVWAALPPPYHNELADRLMLRRWHYSPCMGLSEMGANLEYVGRFEGSPKEPGTYALHSILRQESAKIDVGEASRMTLAIQTLRIPRAVSPDRVFEHAGFFIERDGRPIIAWTEQAWQVDQDMVMFL